MGWFGGWITTRLLPLVATQVVHLQHCPNGVFFQEIQINMIRSDFDVNDESVFDVI
jgi:hypothetical protein